MKKLLTLIVLIFFASCKKSEVSPNICYMIVTDVTTTYGEAAGEIHYNTQGKAQTVKEFKEECNLSIKDLEVLLKSIDGMTHPGIGICIVRGSYYYKIKK